MFWFKRKKIVVDCFTMSAPIADKYFPKKATTFLPEWWKQVPSTIENTDGNGITYKSSTIKRCIGFTELYKKGFMFPMWADLIIKATDTNWAYRYSATELPPVSSHDQRQVNHRWNFSHHHVKIQNPWLVEEKTGVQFLFTAPSWNDDMFLGKFNVLPGVVDFKYQNASHINALVPFNTEITINCGDPVVHVIPLSDYEVDLRTHLISADEHFKKDVTVSYSSKFVGKHRMNISASKEKEAKCPFGFGRK